MAESVCDCLDGSWSHDKSIICQKIIDIETFRRQDSYSLLQISGTSLKLVKFWTRVFVFLTCVPQDIGSPLPVTFANTRELVIRLIIIPLNVGGIINE